MPYGWRTTEAIRFEAVACAYQITKDRGKNNFPKCSYRRQTVDRRFSTVWRP